LFDTSTANALEVLNDNSAVQIYLLTYLLTYLSHIFSFVTDYR